MNKLDKNSAIVRCLQIHDSNILSMAEKLVEQEALIDHLLRSKPPKPSQS